jgi:hypothetical protein
MTLPLTETKGTSDDTSEVGNEHLSELELAGTADANSPIADAYLRAVCLPHEWTGPCARQTHNWTRRPLRIVVAGLPVVQ